MDIKNNELADLLFCTFRYAIGRQTYVVEIACRLISKYQEALDANTKNKLIQELGVALASGALSQIDSPMWAELHAHLIGGSNG